MNPFYKSFFMTVFLYSLFPAGLPAIDSEWILECKDANEQFRPYTANGYMGVKIGNLGTNWKTNHPHMVGNVWIFNIR